MIQGLTVKHGINTEKTKWHLSLYFSVPVIFLSVLFLSVLLYPNHLQASPENKKALIVYQKVHGFSKQLINHLLHDIASNGYQTEKMVLNTKQPDLLRLKKQQLIISIGSQTTKFLLEADINTPVLSLLIPRHIAHTLRSDHPNKNWSSLYIDQPLLRQFHIITAVLGPGKNTGVLLGPYTIDLKENLHKESAKTSHKIKVMEVTSTDMLTPALMSLSHTTDVLLTIPDPVVYNKNTIRSFLSLAYRKKIPIIGFSQAYVKAGAIAALYSKPQQIAKQASDISKYFLNKGKFSSKRFYPEDFSVALNKNIARSLGIKLLPEETIIKLIKKAEHKK
jgi:ABC-type uncharacterized transport system substrate-binding protein